jgi:hypothetical protein
MRTLTRVFVVGALFTTACGPSKRNMGDDDLFPDASIDAPCPTSISGKVFAPNGTLPLYNVTVYVPMSPPGPLETGLSCGQCSTNLPGGALASARTDAEGKFKLEGLQPGTDVPIVITTGKWRRQLTVPLVAQCVDNPVQDGVLRLPKNRSEGDIPRIAMVTGGCDSLACIFRKMGLDATEFGTSSAGPERVVFYNAQGGQSLTGAGDAPTALWNNLEELKKFDMVINSCECSEMNTNKTAPDVLRQYADMGGRVFGSHFHYTWTKNLVPVWQPTATWSTTGAANQTPTLVDTTHPDGMAFSQWLTAVGASSSPGQLTLTGFPQPSASAVNPPTTRWLYASGTNPVTHYLSFKTPVGVPMEQQCGKVVHADLHVSEDSTVNSTFPSGCTAQLSPDEKAMVFLLFDLGSCVDVIF